MFCGKNCPCYHLTKSPNYFDYSSKLIDFEETFLYNHTLLIICLEDLRQMLIAAKKRGNSDLREGFRQIKMEG